MRVISEDTKELVKTYLYAKWKYLQGTVNNILEIGDNCYIIECTERKYILDTIRMELIPVIIKNKDHLTYDEWKREFYRKLKIKIERCKLHYTQREIAEKCEISINTLHNYIYGPRLPTVYTLVKLCEVLDCDVREMTDFNYLL